MSSGIHSNFAGSSSTATFRRRPEESGGRIVLEPSDDPWNATVRVFPAKRHMRLAVAAHIPVLMVSLMLRSSRPYAPADGMRSGNRPYPFLQRAPCADDDIKEQNTRHNYRVRIC